MPPSSRLLGLPRTDPRSYVKSQPLPIASQKGVRIQARSDTVYNPELPKRTDVRKQNYDRRLHQLRCQGFRSRPDRPYQGIGDPFYLESKKLILHSLGQWEEGQRLDSSSSSDSGDEDVLAPEDMKAGAPANFVLRRAKKGLNTLNKEMVRQRGLIRNVRLGRGLFQLLRKEQEEQTSAHQKEAEEKRERERNEWQPPRYDSSSEDESDEDISVDVDLKSYMLLVPGLPAGPPDQPAVDQQLDQSGPDTGPVKGRGDAGPVPEESAVDTSKSRVAFQGVGVDALGLPLGTECVRSQYTQSARSRTSRVSCSSSRKKSLARPYTPQYSCISMDLFPSPDMTAVFRQLCSLHWLLEAMNVEPPFTMGPVSKCWNLREIGGQKTSMMKLQTEKRNDSRWKQFVSNQAFRTGISGKRTSVWKTGNRYKARGSITGHNSAASVQSLTDSRAEPGSAHGRRTVPAIPEGSEVSNELETGTDMTEEEDYMSKGPLRYLDESYDREQLTLDTTSQRDKHSIRSDRSSSGSPQPGRRAAAQEVADTRKSTHSPSVARNSAGGGSTSYSGKNQEEGSEPIPTQEILRFLEMITQSDEDPRFHALANPREKMSSKDLRADINVRARMTPAVMEYIAMLPSNRVGQLAPEQRQRFLEVKQEKALMLHDAIEQKDRQRLRVLQNKFLHMPPGGCSFHRALSAMRGRSASVEEQREQRQHSATTHQAWYIELVNNVPEDMKKEWSFQVILDKLNKYGQVDSLKQSAYKLLKVLAGLRDWEICCPDIAAAIEFCRDKICEMTVEDYEEWFRSQFPAVLRPQTAPAANRNGQSGRRRGGSQTGRSGKAAPRSAPKSAPPGMARTSSF